MWCPNVVSDILARRETAGDGDVDRNFPSAFKCIVVIFFEKGTISRFRALVHGILHDIEFSSICIG